ncbi:MAG TPA: carboxypeptidase-like regulatory domain-containing protein [Terriglobales bacterium]|nr:carboxypeptidase-like regulatory domain-containing protein [Terriglobales bacterium]
MKPRILLPVLSLFLSLIPTISWAQFAQRGGVAGTVFDASGAVVADAQITLLDVAQNQTRVATADKTGHYEFHNLAAGQYRLTASHEGFQTESSELITVNIGAVSDYDFRLHVGSVNQTVTVTAEAGGLETEKISIDTDITARQFEDLPLNGRNFTAIAALAPGVATYPQSNINPGGTYSVGAMFAMGGTSYTVGGSFVGSRDNGFYINGVNVNDNYMSSISFAPSTEALGAGTVQISEFSAATGHDISTLTMQTKAGGSQFHGEAYYFLENDALNAFNPWDNALQIITGTPSAKPIMKRNQFGGNLGGPVPIPHFKNRFFFFANYEKFIEHDGNQLVAASVPSAAERAGDFSELLDPNPNPIQLYNPFFTTYDPETGISTRPPIPGNRLDLATRPDGSPLIDPASAGLLSAFWPLPNISGAPSNEVNYTAYQTPGISNYHIDTRFDARISEKDNVFVAWSKSSGNSTLTGGIPPTQLHNFPVQDQAFLVTANYAHIFTPHLTNELIFGIGDGALVTIQSSLLGWYNGDSNPINQVFQNTGDGSTHGLLAVDAGNYASAGTGEIFRAENKSYQISDNLVWVRGRHSLSMGVNYFRKSEIDWDIMRHVGFGSVDGLNAFSASGSDLGYQGGDGIADLMMGIPNNMWVRFTINGGGPTSPDYNIVFPYWGMYVNDKFRLSPKLTISAGLRYDLSIPTYTPNPAIAPCCAIYTPTSDGGVLQYPGIASGLSNRYLSADKREFAPRLSLAYSPNLKTVIRAGYGVFFDAGASQSTNNVGTAIYGTSAAVNYSVNNSTLDQPIDSPFLNLSNVFPAPVTTTLGSFPVPTGKGQGYLGDDQWAGITYYDQKSTPLPYIQRILLDVQRQIGTHDVFILSYAGSQGRKGQNPTNINLPAYSTGWTFGGGNGDPTYNAARPNAFGRFGDIYVVRPRLNSFYNALIAQYRHDFSNGFQFTSSYSWSKTVGDYPWFNALAANGAPGGAINGFQYPNLNSRGESNQSHRHRFLFSGIWTPGYGKKWPTWAKVPFTGWRLAGIMTLESGEALTVTNGGPGTPCPTSDAGTPICPTGFGSSAQDGDAFDELFVSGNPNLSHGEKSFSRQFDTSKFSVPDMNVRGNSGFGTVRGPGQNRIDLSLAKTFSLYENLHLEFRADAFNAFNHSNWSGVNTTYPSGSAQFPFGQVNGAFEARIVQVAGKVVF